MAPKWPPKCFQNATQIPSKSMQKSCSEKDTKNEGPGPQNWVPFPAEFCQKLNKYGIEKGIGKLQRKVAGSDA